MIYILFMNVYYSHDEISAQTISVDTFLSTRYDMSSVAEIPLLKVSCL